MNIWKLYSNCPGINPAFISVSEAKSQSEAIGLYYVKTGILYDSAEVVMI